MWSGKQIISLIFQPNKQNPVKVNLEASGKEVTKNKEFCVKDSYVLIRNSELLGGALTKAHLGSGGKEKNIFYIILKDYGTEFTIRAMFRLGKATIFILIIFSKLIVGIKIAKYIFHHLNSIALLEFIQMNSYEGSKLKYQNVAIKIFFHFLKIMISFFQQDLHHSF